MLLVSGCAQNGASGRLTDAICGPADWAIYYTDEEIDAMTDEQVDRALVHNEVAAERGCVPKQ